MRRRVGIGPADEVVNRLGRPPSAERDHGGLAGEGLDRHDPEVLLAGEEQGPAASVVVADHLVGLPAEEPDRRAGQPLETGSLGSLADDDQPAARAEQAATAWSRFLYGTRAETQR